MNFGLRHWTTLLLLIWLSYDTNAQRFPVSATIQVLPPYTPYLSDYVSPGQDHIRITLINLDLKEPSIPVKLKIHIEGQGYSFTSGKNVATIPITLQANTPFTLTNEDLRPYIAPGTSFIQSLKTNTSNTSKLNEGAYQFCVEVYHYIRDETPISDMACTVAFLQELDPPIIVAPSFDVIPGNPQAMMIAWHTQHFGGFPVDYELSLYEKIPGMGDQAIVDFTAPIFRQTTPGLAYLYRTDDPPLVIGKTYLVRVQVRDALGRNLFKNHGYSTIAHFQYGRSCDPPLITEAKLFPDGHAHISWTTESNHGNQEIRYRYHDDPNWTVSSVTSALQHLSTSAFHQYAIPITKSSGPLQVQIGASCYSTIAVESAIESIKLDRKSLPRGFYSCGMESSVLDSASTTLINDLNNDDTISANGYLVIIKSANKSGDTYSGECGVMIPMFKGAIIKGHFYDVKVNEDYMMIAGNIKLESAGVQLLSDKYLDLLDGLIETAKTAHDIFSQATFQSAIEYLRPYLGMFLNDSLKDQLQLAIDNLDHASTPEEQLKAQEQLTEVLKDIADAIKLLYDAPYQINFFADKNQRYGFDKFDPSRYRDLVNNYDKLSIAKKEYYVPFKSLEASKGDLLLAKPEVESTDQILFILEDSTEVPATKLTDGSYQLTLPPFPSKGEYNLYAVIKDANPTDSTHDEHIAGQCKIVVYEPQKNNVVLIPINGAKAPNEKSIQDQLNRIYAPAVSQWNVTTLENLDVPGFDNTLDSISTGLLSTYTTEMRSIIKSYIAKYQDDTNSYHLFIVNGSAEQGLLGFMPKKRAYGFITNTDATTIAHELGHGAFRLNHLFDDYTGLRSRTDNLMDYNTPQGSELLHYQWEEVHHPAPMVGWLQGDDEGELVLVDNIVGAVVGALVEVGIQITTNSFQKYWEKKSNISVWKIKWWPDVAISAAAGFASSGAGSLVKFAKFAEGPIAQKALKISIESSTNFLIGVVSDVTNKYLSKEDVNWTNTILTNLVSSAAFSSIFNLVPFAKFKEKILLTFGNKAPPQPDVIFPTYSNSVNNKLSKTTKIIQEKTASKVSSKLKKDIKLEHVQEKVNNSNGLVPVVNNSNPLKNEKISPEIVAASNEYQLEIASDVGESTATSAPLEIEDNLRSALQFNIRNIKAGDIIGGKIINQIKIGTNDKVAIVGRKMDGHVIEAGNSLSELGLEVELFGGRNDLPVKLFKDQLNEIYEIEGVLYNWSQIESDFKMGNYNKDPLTGYIPDSELPKTLMYQANKIWANKLNSLGYTVIDIGYPQGQMLSQSLFYNMELSTIFN